MARSIPCHVATILVLALCLAPPALARVQSPPKRVVTLGILPPGAEKGKSPARLMTLEGEMAGMSLPDDGGKFGFMPSFKKGDDKTVVVTIFDTSAKPNREIGRVNVTVEGKAVQSTTKPPFGIQILSVTSSR